MEGWTVLRMIPEGFRAGIEAGRYTVHGGVIRHAAGSKSIAGHLVMADPSALQGLGAAFGPLLAATTALSGLNLVVSIAGFIVISRKLSAIGKKLDLVIDKLDELLQGQMRTMWLQELERRSSLQANLDNLARGVRIGDDAMTSGALNSLTKNVWFYRASSDHLLLDVRKVYRDPAPLRQCTELALAASLAQSHALALRGHPNEAVRLLDEVEEWRGVQQKTVDEPHKGRPEPTWLGRVPAKSIDAVRAFVRWHREIPEGMAYTRNLYQFCVDNDTTPDELSQMAEGKQLVLLIPKDKEA